ncbi:MAG TPA: hypothetical protein VGY66_17935, partial [Gemmataceae bacterium]|nr:hypothetical protein [Gemmataceae bacterium]
MVPKVGRYTAKIVLGERHAESSGPVRNLARDRLAAASSDLSSKHPVYRLPLLIREQVTVPVGSACARLLHEPGRALAIERQYWASRLLIGRMSAEAEE